MDSTADDFQELLRGWGQTGRLLLLLFVHRGVWLSYWPAILPLASLALVLLLRNGFLWEWLPNLRDSVRQLTDPHGPGLSEIHHQALQRLRTRSETLRLVLARADELLRRLYGPTAFGPLAFDRALSIAALYPICILLGVWSFSGTGRLGSALLLPPLAASKRVSVIIVTLIAIPCFWVLMGSYKRLIQSPTFEGVWTRSGYKAPEKKLAEFLIQGVDAVLYPCTLQSIREKLGKLRQLGWREFIAGSRRGFRGRAQGRDGKRIASSHNSQTEEAHFGKPLLDAMATTVGLILLMFVLFMLDRWSLEVRRSILVSSDETVLASVTYDNVLNVAALCTCLILSVLGIAEGNLAGMITVPMICTITIISVLPEERHGRYTAVVVIICAVCGRLYQTLIDARSGKVPFNVSRVFLCMALAAVLPLIAAVLPQLPVMSAAPSNTWAADRFALNTILFAGVVPLYSGILDYLSVATTRTFISAYLRGSLTWVRFWVLDLGAAISLMVLTCAGTLQILFLMKGLGWQVDASAMATQFVRDPWGAQTLWVTLSAVTNLLPTLLHLTLLLCGLLTARFLRDGTVVDRLCEALKAGKPLHPVDARVLVRYLLVDRYLAFIFVVVSTICSIYTAVPWLLGFLVVS